MKKPQAICRSNTKQLLGFLTLLICNAGFGQTDSLAVPFVAYWSIGDTYEYRITRIRTSFNEDKPTKTDSTTYFGTFSVIDSTATEYLINWKYKANFTDLPLEYSELLNNNNIILDFKYKTDELGQFIELENWQEVADVIRSSIDNDLLPKFESSVTKNSGFLKDYYDNLLTKEGIEELVLGELMLFHFPFGVEFDPTIPITYEDEYTNFISNTPLRGQVEINFTEVDYDDHFCTFTQKGKINEADAKMMLIGIFEKMIPEGFRSEFDIKRAEEEINDWKYEITNDNIFAYYYFPGVPVYIETNRKVEIVAADIQQKQVETKRIEIILDDE